MRRSALSTTASWITETSDVQAYTLDSRFTLVMKGLEATAFTKMENGDLLRVGNDDKGTVSVSKDGGYTWAIVGTVARTFPIRATVLFLTNPNLSGPTLVSYRYRPQPSASYDLRSN